MAKVDLPYLNCFRDRHGRTRCYYRREGKNSAVAGAPGSPEFLRAYQEIDARFAPEERRPGPAAGTFGHLVEHWYGSAEFIGLRPGTKAEYKRHIEPLRALWEAIAATGISRRVILDARDDRAAWPVSANNQIHAVSALFGWAVSRELVEANPAAKIKPLLVDSDGWTPWPEEALRRFAEQSKGAPRTAFYLALYTGQRRADVLAMRWDAIDRGGITLRQKKGARNRNKTDLFIPLHPILLAELERTKRQQVELAAERREKKLAAATGLTIVQKRNGTHYTDDGFGSLWNREQHRLGCAGLPFHGLRKNAAITLIEAGCSPDEAQAITGHESLDMLQHYAKRKNQRRLALSAMKKILGSAAGGEDEK